MDRHQPAPGFTHAQPEHTDASKRHNDSMATMHLRSLLLLFPYIKPVMQSARALQSAALIAWMSPYKICRCVTFGCGKTRLHEKSGKWSHGRYVTSSELQRHRAEDDARARVRSETSFTFAREYDSTLLSFAPAPHWKARAPRRQEEATTSPRDAAPRNAVPVICFTAHDMTAILNDLTARMSFWQSYAASTPFDAGPGTLGEFPLSSDLEWLHSTRDRVRNGDVGDDEKCKTLRDQVLCMAETQVARLEGWQQLWNSARVIPESAQNTQPTYRPGTSHPITHSSF